jgi:hypothetical protein
MSLVFEKLYFEEAHLFDVVGPHFRETGRLTAYDLFFIVRWKSNRALGKMIARVRRLGDPDPEKAVAKLAGDLFRAKDAHARFRILSTEWGMRLPMASAILTVLYPEEFTVYDVNVCKEIGCFRELANRQDVESRWSGYLKFKAEVERRAPPNLSLRDKDRYLWAQSRHKRLVQAIANGFARAK